MGNRKKWTGNEKIAAVLDGLKGKPLREITAEYGISEGQYYKWRDEAFGGMREALKDKRRKENRSPDAERNRLLKIIGEQQLIIDLQKKISREMGLS